MAGASTGRALLDARQRYVRETGALTPVDLKTLAQFDLLGDPSLVAVAGPPGVPSRGRRAAARQGRPRSPTLGQRRAVLAATGRALDTSVPRAGRPAPLRGRRRRSWPARPGCAVSAGRRRGHLLRRARVAAAGRLPLPRAAGQRGEREGLVVARGVRRQPGRPARSGASDRAGGPARRAGGRRRVEVRDDLGRPGPRRPRRRRRWCSGGGRPPRSTPRSSWRRYVGTSGPRPRRPGVDLVVVDSDELLDLPDASRDLGPRRVSLHHPQRRVAASAGPGRAPSGWPAGRPRPAVHGSAVEPRDRQEQSEPVAGQDRGEVDVDATPRGAAGRRAAPAAGAARRPAEPVSSASTPPGRRGRRRPPACAAANATRSAAGGVEQRGRAGPVRHSRIANAGRGRHRPGVPVVQQHVHGAGLAVHLPDAGEHLARLHRTRAGRPRWPGTVLRRPRCATAAGRPRAGARRWPTAGRSPGRPGSPPTTASQSRRSMNRPSGSGGAPRVGCRVARCCSTRSPKASVHRPSAITDGIEPPERGLEGPQLVVVHVALGRSWWRRGSSAARCRRRRAGRTTTSGLSKTGSGRGSGPRRGFASGVGQPAPVVAGVHPQVGPLRLVARPGRPPTRPRAWTAARSSRGLRRAGSAPDRQVLHRGLRQAVDERVHSVAAGARCWRRHAPVTVPTYTCIGRRRAAGPPPRSTPAPAARWCPAGSPAGTRALRRLRPTIATAAESKR